MASNSLFFNYSFDKNRFKALISWSLLNFGEKSSLTMVEKVKQIGFQYATQAGASLGLDDLRIPPTKRRLVSETEFEVQLAETSELQGNLTAIERFQHLIDRWHRTSENLKGEVVEYFRSTDLLNPVYMMAFSGARGNVSQVRQLVGMRGLMADPQGQIISFPIGSNFREGLTLTEYVISCYGARKGLVDTALRTANAGYLTRRLVDVSQHVVVSQFDCKTRRGILMTGFKDKDDVAEKNNTILSLRNRLVGRVLAENIRSVFGSDQGNNKNEKMWGSKSFHFSFGEDLKETTNASFLRTDLTKNTIYLPDVTDPFPTKPLYLGLENKVLKSYQLHLVEAKKALVRQLKTKSDRANCFSFEGKVYNQSVKKKGVIVGYRNQQISTDLAEKIATLREKVLIRSPLSCERLSSICQLCYGWNLSQGKLVPLGKAVGVIAAQSIGEPGTQLTMRTFHTGGVFSGDVVDEIRAPHKGKVEFVEPLQGILLRTSHGIIAFRAKVKGFLIIKSDLASRKENNQTEIQTPPLTILFVKHKEEVVNNQLVAEIPLISAQMDERVTAKYDLGSQFQGEIFFEGVTLGFKKTRSSLMNRETRKIGSIWVLSGKIYKAPVGGSTFFLEEGDFVDQKTILNQLTTLALWEGFVFSMGLQTNKPGCYKDKKDALFYNPKEVLSTGCASLERMSYLQSSCTCLAPHVVQTSSLFGAEQDNQARRAKQLLSTSNPLIPPLSTLPAFGIPFLQSKNVNFNESIKIQQSSRLVCLGNHLFLNRPPFSLFDRPSWFQKVSTSSRKMFYPLAKYQVDINKVSSKNIILEKKTPIKWQTPVTGQSQTAKRVYFKKDLVAKNKLFAIEKFQVKTQTQTRTQTRLKKGGLVQPSIGPEINTKQYKQVVPFLPFESNKVSGPLATIQTKDLEFNRLFFNNNFYTYHPFFSFLSKSVQYKGSGYLFSFYNFCLKTNCLPQKTISFQSFHKTSIYAFLLESGCLGPKENFLSLGLNQIGGKQVKERIPPTVANHGLELSLNKQVKLRGGFLRKGGKTKLCPKKQTFNKKSSQNHDLFFAGNSLTKGFHTINSIKSGFHLQYFPYQYIKKTGIINQKQPLYLVEDLNQGELLWIPEHTYQVKTKTLQDNIRNFLVTSTKVSFLGGPNASVQRKKKAGINERIYALSLFYAIKQLNRVIPSEKKTILLSEGKTKNNKKQKTKKVPWDASNLFNFKPKWITKNCFLGFQTNAQGEKKRLIAPISGWLTGSVETNYKVLKIAAEKKNTTRVTFSEANPKYEFKSLPLTKVKSPKEKITPVESKKQTAREPKIKPRKAPSSKGHKSQVGYQIIDQQKLLKNKILKNPEKIRTIKVLETNLDQMKKVGSFLTKYQLTNSNKDWLGCKVKLSSPSAAKSVSLHFKGNTVPKKQTNKLVATLKKPKKGVLKNQSQGNLPSGEGVGFLKKNGLVKIKPGFVFFPSMSTIQTKTNIQSSWEKNSWVQSNLVDAGVLGTNQIRTTKERNITFSKLLKSHQSLVFSGTPFSKIVDFNQSNVYIEFVKPSFYYPIYRLSCLIENHILLVLMEKQQSFFGLKTPVLFEKKPQTQINKNKNKTNSIPINSRFWITKLQHFSNQQAATSLSKGYRENSLSINGGIGFSDSTLSSIKWCEYDKMVVDHVLLKNTKKGCLKTELTLISKTSISWKKKLVCFAPSPPPLAKKNGFLFPYTCSTSSRESGFTESEKIVSQDNQNTNSFTWSKEIPRIKGHNLGTTKGEKTNQFLHNNLSKSLKRGCFSFPSHPRINRLLSTVQPADQNISLDSYFLFLFRLVSYNRLLCETNKLTSYFWIKKQIPRLQESNPFTLKTFLYEPNKKEFQKVLDEGNAYENFDLNNQTKQVGFKVNKVNRFNNENKQDQSFFNLYKGFALNEFLSNLLVIDNKNSRWFKESLFVLQTRNLTRRRNLITSNSDLVFSVDPEKRKFQTTSFLRTGNKEVRGFISKVRTQPKGQTFSQPYVGLGQQRRVAILVRRVESCSLFTNKQHKKALYKNNRGNRFQQLEYLKNRTTLKKNTPFEGKQPGPASIEASRNKRAYFQLREMVGFGQDFNVFSKFSSKFNKQQISLNRTVERNLLFPGIDVQLKRILPSHIFSKNFTFRETALSYFFVSFHLPSNFPFTLGKIKVLPNKKILDLENNLRILNSIFFLKKQKNGGAKHVPTENNLQHVEKTTHGYQPELVSRTTLSNNYNLFKELAFTKRSANLFKSTRLINLLSFLFSPRLKVDSAPPKDKQKNLPITSNFYGTGKLPTYFAESAFLESGFHFNFVGENKLPQFINLVDRINVCKSGFVWNRSKVLPETEKFTKQIFPFEKSIDGKFPLSINEKVAFQSSSSTKNELLRKKNYGQPNKASKQPFVNKPFNGQVKLKQTETYYSTIQADQNGWIDKTSPAILTSFLSPYVGEITGAKEENSTWLLLTSQDQLTYRIVCSSETRIKVGQFVRYGEEFSKNLGSTIPGQVFEITGNRVTLRRGQPVLFLPNTQLYVHHEDFVEKKAPLLTFLYQKLITGDIVQGIPKIEQLFEGRQTKDGEIIPNNLLDKLTQFFHYYQREALKTTTNYRNFLLRQKIAVRKSLKRIQLILVEKIKKVYLSQGVVIAEKHLEIIVRQMTSKVQITRADSLQLIRDELIDLISVEWYNSQTFNKRDAILYRPTILGITKASLEARSFLSAASFQETTKVLSRATIQKKQDLLAGLKQRVIVGDLINAGTAWSSLKNSKQLLIKQNNTSAELFAANKPDLGS